MGERSLAVVALAAGKGTRLNSSLAKVLQPLAGRPLLHHVLSTLEPLHPDPLIVVVGYQADRVKSAFFKDWPHLQYVIQEEQLGTGHAALQAEKALQDFSGDLLIVCGDMPFVTTRSLQRMVDERRKGYVGVVMTFKNSENADFGRIIRASNGDLLRIVEHKDATVEEKKVDEFNAGVYCFQKGLLFEALKNLETGNAQNEYYLTDTIEWLKKMGHAVSALMIEDSQEVFGINSQEDLARAEQIAKSHL